MSAAQMMDSPAGPERRRRSRPNAPRRRYGDTLFNRIKWPLVVAIWFVGGLALLAYLLLRLIA